MNLLYIPPLAVGVIVFVGFISFIAGISFFKVWNFLIYALVLSGFIFLWYWIAHTVITRYF